MTATISVVTPSYSGDFERCRLLCDSMDRHATGYGRHYIVVDDEEAGLFAPLAGAKREVIVSSQLLPKFWPVGRWRGRRYRWKPGLGLPVYGWHLQQLRKIAMALLQPSDRVVCVDSDTCFCRPGDLGELAADPKVSHFVRQGEIGPDLPSHVLWRENAYRVLGLAAPPLPGDDFIGQMVVWERATVRAMVERIELASGTAWWDTLARIRDFSEYMIYGAAVASDPVLARRHERSSASRCLTYWSGPALDEGVLARLIDGLGPHQYGIAIQSHTHTSIDLVRAAVLSGAPARS